jgi:hypothetical protein
VTSATETETELLAAAVSRLAEQGYNVIVEPSAALLPKALQGRRPDAIAIGRSPKLIVEIASEGPKSAQRVAELQHALKAETDWKLHLVVSRIPGETELGKLEDSEILPVLDRAVDVASIEPRAALMMVWAAFEALSRSRRPKEFSRPQSPGRIIERLATDGVVGARDADFLRSMAHARNRYVHGGLNESVGKSEVTRFVLLLRELIA